MGGRRRISTRLVNLQAAMAALVFIAGAVALAVHGATGPQVVAARTATATTVAAPTPPTSAPTTVSPNTNVPLSPSTTAIPATTTTVRPKPFSLLGKMVFESSRRASCQTNCFAVASAYGETLWTANLDGTDQRELTPLRAGTAGDIDPDLSPDGTKITWVVGYSLTAYDVWSMNADGTDPQQLTKIPGAINTEPKWSPDGRRIAYVHAFSNGTAYLMIMNADGSDAHQVSDGGLNVGQFSWAPDGTRLAVSIGAPFGIAVVNLATGSVQVIHHGGGQFPAWSPDGSTILYTYNNYGRSGIYALRPDGSGLRTVVSAVSQDMDYSDPAWLPNGQTILVSVFVSVDLKNLNSQIYRLNADGSGAHQLTFQPGSNDGASP